MTCLTYTYTELVEFYLSLDQDEPFSAKASNDGCGCLLTKFFRSRGVVFNEVTMTQAWHVDKSSGRSTVTAKPADGTEFLLVHYFIENFLFLFLAPGHLQPKKDIHPRLFRFIAKHKLAS